MDPKHGKVGGKGKGGDIKCPVGRCGTESPPSLAGIHCLPMTSLVLFSSWLPLKNRLLISIKESDYSTLSLGKKKECN